MNGEYEAELFRMLSDERMAGFWGKLKSDHIVNSCDQTSNAALIQSNWDGLVRSLIALMAFKGGQLPDMTEAAFWRARNGDSKGTGIENSLRTLKIFLKQKDSAHENVADLTISDLVDICEKSSNTQISENGKAARASLKLSYKQPTFIQILEAIEEQINKKQFLSTKDQLALTPYTITSERKDAQEKYFCEVILDLLYWATSKNKWSLTAQLRNVVFNIPAGSMELISAEDLRSRLK